MTDISMSGRFEFCLGARSPGAVESLEKVIVQL